MSDHVPPHRTDGVPDKSTLALAAMTDAEIDATLSAMAHASQVLRQESDTEERRRDQLNDQSEALIEQRAAGQGSRFSVEFELLSVRHTLANNSANWHWNAAREYVSWWADAATTAWEAAVLGTPVRRSRLFGAAPEMLLTDEELAVLPQVDEYERQLVELDLFLDSPAYVRSGHHEEENPAGLSAALAARSGLRIRPSAAGGTEIADGDAPEARRRRFWGDLWIDHRVPTFTEPDVLETLLSRAPSESQERLRGAIKAVVRAVIAGSRLNEMENTVQSWSPEDRATYNELIDQMDSLTALLADYAQIVTDALPALRAAANTGQEAPTKTDPIGFS